LLESEIEKKASDYAASDYAEDLGYVSLKINVVGQRGWPDHLFINPHGESLWVEFKKSGERPDKLQRHRLKTLRKQEVEAYWVDNFEDAKQLLDEGLDVGKIDHIRYSLDDSL